VIKTSLTKEAEICIQDSEWFHCFKDWWHSEKLTNILDSLLRLYTKKQRPKYMIWWDQIKGYQENSWKNRNCFGVTSGNFN